jgi:hypothetical protein
MGSFRKCACGAAVLAAMIAAPGASWAASVELDCPINPGVVRFWIDYDSNAVKYAFYSGNGSIYSRGDGQNVEITRAGIALRAANANVGINRLTGQIRLDGDSAGTCTPGNTPYPDEVLPPQKF